MNIGMPIIMKKRIGSKLYDTETAEYLCAIDGGQLYQKRTRDREYFAVMDDGTVKPLDAYNPLDMLLMETGRIPERQQSDHVMVRVDRETHNVIAGLAKADGLSITEEMRKIVKNMV